MDKQGNTYTFLYASVMVIVVAAVLAFVSESLKPIQNKNADIAKKIDILKSVNISSTAKDAEAVYEQNIKNTYALNLSGQKVEGVDAFRVDLAKELAKAPDARNYPIYESNVNGETKYIIPLRGKGLWGPIWGYVALNADKKTIFGATFGHKGETPGLGAEIDKDWFQKPFVGKSIFDANGTFVAIKVEKTGQGGQHPESEVDAISGGTITSKGLEAMLYDNLSGYKEFLTETNSTENE